MRRTESRSLEAGLWASTRLQQRAPPWRLQGGTHEIVARKASISRMWCPRISGGACSSSGAPDGAGLRAGRSRSRREEQRQEQTTETTIAHTAALLAEFWFHLSRTRSDTNPHGLLRRSQHQREGARGHSTHRGGHRPRVLLVRHPRRDRPARSQPRGVSVSVASGS